MNRIVSGKVFSGLSHLTTFVILQAALAIHGGQQMADPNFDPADVPPTYVEEHPRVLFDEAHFNFHTAAGRYKPFVDLTTNDGYVVTPNKEKFQQKTLTGYSILVIANAQGSNQQGDNSAFTEEECDAVCDWVSAGGSLLLITDIYPFGAAAERLVSRFGVKMSKGYTEDPVNQDKNAHAASHIVFTRDNGLIVEHPITEGRKVTERIRRVMSFKGQSLEGPEGSVSFLQLADTAIDRMPELTEIENLNGLPEKVIKYADPVSAAGRAQGIALKFGKGRVIVLGEAAMLTAQIGAEDKRPFGMNVQGIDNRQLALNIMHWLSGLL